MADNVRTLVAGAVHKAQVGGGGGPANCGWGIAHVGVLVNKVPSVAAMVLAVVSVIVWSKHILFPTSNDARNVAVARHERR